MLVLKFIKKRIPAIPKIVTTSITFLPNLSEKYVFNAQMYMPIVPIPVLSVNKDKAMFSGYPDKNSSMIREGMSVGKEVV